MLQAQWPRLFMLLVSSSRMEEAADEMGGQQVEQRALYLRTRACMRLGGRRAPKCRVVSAREVRHTWKVGRRRSGAQAWRTDGLLLKEHVVQNELGDAGAQGEVRGCFG
jgi:hypothetical protein